LVESLPGRDVNNWANLGFLMVDHDFNFNVRIGYDDVLLDNYLLSLVGDDKKHLKVNRSAQYCTALVDSNTMISTTYYNKLSYYIFVHSLRKTLGAQLSGLFFNEDPDL
jgi:hypothetical protein